MIHRNPGFGSLSSVASGTRGKVTIVLSGQQLLLLHYTGGHLLVSTSELNWCSRLKQRKESMPKKQYEHEYRLAMSSEASEVTAVQFLIQDRLPRTSPTA